MPGEACPTCGESEREPQFFGAPEHQCDLGGLRLVEVRHEAAREVPRHAHSTAFVSVLIAGRYQSRFGRTAMDFRPGCAVWHEDGFDHEDSIAEGGALFFCVEVERERLDSLGAWQARKPLSAALGDSASVSLLRLFIANRTNGDGLHLEALSSEFLGAAVEGDVDAAGGSWLSRVVERLRCEPGARASLSELAEIAGVHPCHLTRSFRARFACSIGEYARMLRLRCAWERLTDPGTDIAELAYSLGYSDQAHFTREFASVLKIPPARARRAILA